MSLPWNNFFDVDMDRFEVCKSLCYEPSSLKGDFALYGIQFEAYLYQLFQALRLLFQMMPPVRRRPVTLC